MGSTCNSCGVKLIGKASISESGKGYTVSSSRKAYACGRYSKGCKMIYCATVLRSGEWDLGQGTKEKGKKGNELGFQK